MKTLQNDFTTPEQSKRLLELGVPADSADCYQVPNGLFQHPYILVDLFSKTDFIPPKDEVLPCWSVGRLIEIIGICDEWFDYLDNDDITGSIVDFIDGAVRMNYIDFSKLED